jgi:hypothetical protein
LVGSHDYRFYSAKEIEEKREKKGIVKTSSGGRKEVVCKRKGEEEGRKEGRKERLGEARGLKENEGDEKIRKRDTG